MSKNCNFDKVSLSLPLSLFLSLSFVLRKKPFSKHRCHRQVEPESPPDFVSYLLSRLISVTLSQLSILPPVMFSK